MLPATVRLRTPAEFSRTVRGGRRGSARSVVVHLLATERLGPARAGFVVSRAVGNSVVRHRVTRRLRPLVRARLAGLPAGSDLVVRALPASAVTSGAALAADLDRALTRARRAAPVDRTAS